MKKEIINRFISSMVILPLSIIIIINGSYLFYLFLILFFAISSYEWIRMSKNSILSVAGIIYLLFSIIIAHLLRGNDHFNFLIFIFVILICISTDIGGYVFGKYFKGPKLTKISPNKTYVGVLGSFILSLLFGYIYSIFFQNELDLLFYNKFLLIFSIFIISLVSQLGDLLISFFKRLSKIKNTGNIIPGHGGILDRADGIIFAIPFSYIYFRFLIQ